MWFSSASAPRGWCRCRSWGSCWCEGYLTPAAYERTVKIGPSSAAASAQEMPEEVRRSQAEGKNDLGKYVKVRLLGRGGMGEVWKAWEKGLGRYVAIKPQNIAEDPGRPSEIMLEPSPMTRAPSGSSRTLPAPMGKTQEARLDFERALQLAPKDGTNRGRILEALERLKR